MAESSAALTLSALDPARSVVVEACAGSGKTWLLASRIVRLLLAGVAPGEILAITFTRKAAREIEERVVGWLQTMATADDGELAVFLAERGVAPVGADQLRAARGLYERVLAAQPALNVNTFHGWFLQLVDVAPLSAGLAGATLAESGARLFDELWQSFAARLQKAADSAATQCFVRLLADAGSEQTRRLIRRALDRRSEWLAFGESGERRERDVAAQVVGALRELLNAGAPGDALAAFFSGEWAGDFQAYLGFLEMSALKGDVQGAANLRAALGETDAALRFAGLQSVLLTREQTLRAKKPGKTLDARYTPAGAARFLDLHARLGAALLDCLEAQRAEAIVAFNHDASTVFQAFLAHVDEFKQARRQIDFVDAEWNVLKLLRHDDTAAFLQARLDSRYRHVLLDEFQDTSPLQWQILLGWLAAYSDGARPSVFLVGDPKQSIYRFRRAEPRLFLVAADFLQSHFAAIRCELDSTRRNARAIVDVVNALFLGVPEFAPFRAQSTLAGALPGRVELLPLCAKDADDSAQDGEARRALRDPLAEAALEPEDSRRQQEAERLAAKLREMLGADGSAWQIDERAADGTVRRRPLRCDDIMLLVRTRTHLACYERALAAAAIPFVAGSRGGLLAALEVRDVVALLEFLVTPLADLKLAQALRSPLFACSDDDLMALASRSEAGWWRRLQALTAEGLGSPPLARAARLLGAWLPAADRLPAHDLLDRIYHQGEVLARYRLAVPESLVAGVEANLQALLQFALDVDGGRYPSLPRFIDELRELRDGDDSEAPDEGAIESAGADAGRVRILTIHGAKGLEAPVVWLLDANAAPRAPDAWDLLVDWPPQAAAPAHVSFYGRQNERGKARTPLFDAEQAAAAREELNLLYVAITRARQVFIASGIDNAKAGAQSPYRLLEAALGTLCGALAYGDALPLAAQALPAAPASVAASLPSPLPAIGERRQPPGEAERFGVLLHALLERRSEGTADDGWWTALGFADDDYRRVLPVAERILGASVLQRFFDPAQYRRAWNEVDLCTRAGALLRIDRLVELDDACWVLDYKSSRSDTARLDEYRAQVAEYCSVVADVFPGKAVRGALIFGDATLFEVC